ncbi:MAG: hypothetical protein KF832_09935 [Caldilineaceae bacterium]|nr:hypothetical protein [Caldilineaceae bacterium]
MSLLVDDRTRPHGWRVRQLLYAMLLAAIFVLCNLSLNGMPTVQAAACTGSGITGVVFRDYNANAERDLLEPGVAGMVVTAYDASGTTTSCESTADGTYGIDPVGAYPLRLEVTLPADGTLAFLKPGAAGNGARTTVTFVDGPTANVDVGFNNPADFCGKNPAPTLATSCFVFGEQQANPDGVNQNKNVMYTFPYTAGSTLLTDAAAVSSPAPAQVAAAREIGTVWGLAWNPQSRILYAAAFLKRHAGFGPGGPGAIYQIPESGVATLFYNFGAQFGTDPHPQPGQTCLSPGHNANSTNANCWLNDSNAFDQVGKASFGDLDMGEDLQTLYTVNLLDNTLWAIPLANPSAPATFALPMPSTCPTVDVRPFGLGIQDGKVYVGMVCSAESTQLAANLRGYVYVFADGAFAPTPVLDFPLTYNRGASNLQWQYWLNRTSFNRNNALQAGGKWAQPWLTDIVFDGEDMILGLRDRNSDQFGTVAGGPDPADPTNYTAFARGDILRACATGSGTWQLESNGTCGAATTVGLNNGQGPGGGEYYFQDQQFEPAHSETSLGAQVQIPGLPDVASVIYNPIEGMNNDARSDGGIKWYQNATGITTRSYLLFDGSGEIALFDKANGLGDLEALCPAAPLEIGNRVWQDTNGNGVQDPGEPGLDGVTVELYRDGLLVGMTTTANGGEYLFTDANVTQNGATGIEAGLCGPTGEAVYEIRIPNITGTAQQPALNGLILTQAELGGATNGELRDSNGTLVADYASYAVPCRDLSAPGFNNHTYDFGFIPLASQQAHSLGNYVWIDANNDGLVTSGEAPVPNGVVVELLDATGAPTGQTSLTNNGFYLFSGLTAGTYRVRLAASNFQTGAVLASYTSSTGPGQEANPDANGDQNDNGLDGGTPALDGIVSAPVTLDIDEPTGETPTASGIPGNDGVGTPDASSNLTVDFGLVPPAVERVAIGNVVFRDLGNNGRFDATDGGMDGVAVALFVAGADPVTTAPLATTTTSGGGFYLFDNLPPGHYFVHLLASNFQRGALLANYRSSTGHGTSTSADDDVDENGIDEVDLATNGLRSIVYDLQPNLQPTAESGAGRYGGALDDDNVNLTADFGVYKPLSLGNRVWLDNGAGGGIANNGIMEGAEPGIANVLVRLLDGNGNPVNDANGQVLVATTDAQGYYNFVNLLPGTYKVLIDASNFQAGGPLAALNSSGPTELIPDDDGDLNDNGLNVDDPTVAGVWSGIITMDYDTEPTDETDLGPVGLAEPPDINNLTIDFGFFQIPTAIEEGAEPTIATRLYLPLVRE